jgi:hypothetical protein
MITEVFRIRTVADNPSETQRFTLILRRYCPFLMYNIFVSIIVGFVRFRQHAHTSRISFDLHFF